MINPIVIVPMGAPRPSRFHVFIAELDGEEAVFAFFLIAPFVFLAGAVALLVRSLREGRGLRLVWKGARR